MANRRYEGMVTRAMSNLSDIETRAGRWIKKPHGEAVTSPNGRFVLTDGYEGTSYQYNLYDNEEGRSYRSRTLEGVREDVTWAMSETKGEG